MYYVLKNIPITYLITDDSWWVRGRCFAAAGPKLWNSLPTELRQADISFQRFKRLLKTFLFRCWDRGTLSLTAKAVRHKFSYLLTYKDALKTNITSQYTALISVMFISLRTSEDNARSTHHPATSSVFQCDVHGWTCGSGIRLFPSMGHIIGLVQHITNNSTTFSVFYGLCIIQMWSYASIFAFSCWSRLECFVHCL